MNNTKVMGMRSEITGVYSSYDSDLENNQHKIIRAQFEKYLHPYMVMELILFALLALEIYRWHTQSPPLPGIYFALLLFGLTYTAYRIHEDKDYLRFIHLGRYGEPDASILLDKYSKKSDIKVFKDTSFGDFKVNYIIVDKAGVVIVKIINWYAPANTEAVVRYNDDEILLNGYRPEANPLVGQKHLAKWLVEKLNRDTDVRVNMQSLIMIPEWFVEPPQETTAVRVINPRELTGYLESRPKALSRSDKLLLDDHIERLVAKDLQL
ncbi:MAG: hypothetical protein AAF372_01410 [Pseudomonadota bacterium]